MKFKTNCKLDSNQETNLPSNLHSNPDCKLQPELESDSSSKLPSNSFSNLPSNPQPNSDCKLQPELESNSSSNLPSNAESKLESNPLSNTKLKLDSNPKPNSPSNLHSNSDCKLESNPQPNSDCKLEPKLKCKYCNSDAIKCNGNKYNKQRYYCNDCHKSFSLTDNRIKRDIKQRELCLLLYSHNMSMRSIQSTIQMFFNTKISFRLIEKWIKSFSKLLNYDISRQEKDKPRTIEIVELDELYSYYYDTKNKEKENERENNKEENNKGKNNKEEENKENKSKYGLLLTETEIKLLHIK